MCTKRQSAAYARAATPSLKMVEWGNISSRRRHLISFRLLPCIPCQPTASLSGPPSMLHYKRPFICIQHAVTPLYGIGNVRVCVMCTQGGGGREEEEEVAIKKQAPSSTLEGGSFGGVFIFGGRRDSTRWQNYAHLFNHECFKVQTRGNYSMAFL